MTLGSLFDGAGTVPFAAQILGIETLWSSEIEKFPLEVTVKRFPNVKQLGDVTKIKGDEVEPVDIIAFGSPCQDLSVAGRGAGLSGERSGLFMEAIRIIKEMRQATNGRSPTFAIWENVPGAFSSNKGEDFRIVIEEFCKIKDSNADIPRPTDRKGKCAWSDAGGVLGDGYSVAWRVLDAQFWGVPQRRRRIFLVADFRGERAGEILFKRDGLSRNFAESRETWQGITKSLAFRSATQSGATYCLQGNGIDRADTAGCNGRGWREDSSYTLNTIDRPAVCMCSFEPGVMSRDGGHVYDNVAGTLRANPGDNHLSVCCFKADDCKINDISPCLVGDHNNRVMDHACIVFHCLQDPVSSPMIAPCLTQGSPVGAASLGVVAIDRAAYNQGQNAKYDMSIDDTGKAQFLCLLDIPDKVGTICAEISKVTSNQIVEQGQIVCYGVPLNFRPENTKIYEEVSATLCNGTNPGHHTGTLCFTPCDIILRRLTPTECARLQGMPDWWCDDVSHADSAEYKMWGNGMALPNVLYVLEGIVEALKGEKQ